MVRLTALLLALVVLYYATVDREPKLDFTYEEPSVITVIELPPIEDMNDN